MMTIHFTDSSLSEMNGSFTSFYQNGIVENVGSFKKATIHYVLKYSR